MLIKAVAYIKWINYWITELLEIFRSTDSWWMHTSARECSNFTSFLLCTRAKPGITASILCNPTSFIYPVRVQCPEDLTIPF